MCRVETRDPSGVAAGPGEFRDGGRFEEACIQRGIPTREAKVADLDGDGWPHIVGKPYNPQRHIDVRFNES